MLSQLLFANREIAPVTWYEPVWLLYTALAFPFFFVSGFYSHIWRFASIRQYLYLFSGSIIYTFALVGISLILNQGWQAAYYFEIWMITFLTVTGLRVAYRLVYNHNLLPFLSKDKAPDPEGGSDIVRVMVIGAGYAGSQIIREMIESKGRRRPIVAIDDDPDKQHLRIHNVPIIGGCDSIITAVEDYDIEEIIVAMPGESKQAISGIVEICSRTECQLRILPHMQDLISGKISISHVKEVEIADLLGRDQIQLDSAQIAQYLHGASVMVTGGGGSIGSELCRQICRFGPRRLVIFDIYENYAYQMHQELIGRYPDIELIVAIGSVRDRLRLDDVFEKFRPEVVFHAAAHKHVPLMEDSPGEAVKNNIFGTYNTAEVAARYKVKRFVLISTDKAVNPTNVMGASKRIAEMIVQSLDRQHPHTWFTAVRFGNVLGSSGSVIPLFKQQIREQRKVTVTHPDITRYFMTIPEAASLVMQAGALARGGEIFVLDMGEPVKIIDLARDLIRLSGLRPGVDVKIEITGLRPGEKMHEELYLNNEELDRTRHEKIMSMKPIRSVSDIESELAGLIRLLRWDSQDFMKLRDLLLTWYRDALNREAKTAGTAKSGPEKPLPAAEQLHFNQRK